MAQWRRQPQERNGNYFFSGQFYATRTVSETLSLSEILHIYLDVKAFARDKIGIDYLQVYTDERGRKLYFIDQLNKKMIESGLYKPEDNHCTLMFAEEY